MSQRDAVLILGGGVRSGGELPPWARARFDLALERHQGEPFVCLSAATTHRPPPLDEEGFPIPEAWAGAQYLLSRGVQKELIRVEAASYDTIGNAYFSKLLHVDPEGWSRLLVITSEFHMPRTRAVFEWVFGMEIGPYELEFAAAADEGLEGRALEARRAKESAALEGLSQTRSRIQTFRELHRWLFTEHGAYAADAKWRRDRAQDEEVMRSY